MQNYIGVLVVVATLTRERKNFLNYIALLHPRAHRQMYEILSFIDFLFRVIAIELTQAISTPVRLFGYIFSYSFSQH